MKLSSARLCICKNNVFVFSSIKVLAQNSVIAIFIFVFVCLYFVFEMLTLIFAFVFFFHRYFFSTVFLCIYICSLSSEVLCELVPQVKQVELDPTRLEAISSN